VSPNDDNPYLHGSYGPVDREVDAAELPLIAGRVPDDLDGLYVRNGPNAKFAPKGRYHWFDGDGMLHAVRFAGGRASYRNRYVRTAGLAADEAAGAAQWTGLMEPRTGNPRGAPYKDTANTDVYFHNGALIATWYICGQPYRVDAETLETLGATNFGADQPIRMSAHGKVDEATGELCFFDYGPKPPYMRFGVVDPDGRLIRLTSIDLPGPRLPHDMAITERFAVLHDLPVVFSGKAAAKQKWAIRYDRNRPARFGILPRDGSGAIRWFEAEPCYIYHVVNAWEEGSEVVMVGCRCDDPVPPPDPADGAWRYMMANLRLTARLYRWRFDLETGQTCEEPIDDRRTEFPTIDADRLGRRTRFAYHQSFADSPTLLFDGIVKYDTDSGAATAMQYGPGRYGSESPFARARGRTGEDDGYLVSFVHDQREDRSEVVIVDARDVAAGPVARLALPQRVPLGFHACWVPGERL
jgi:carotenoid cleavage dioxygenase